MLLLMTGNSQSAFLQFDLDNGIRFAMLYVFSHRTCATENARPSSESEANGTHDRRLPSSVCTNNDVKSRSRINLHL